MTNSSYLAFGIEDWPSEIFNHDGSNLRDDAVHASCLRKRKAGEPLSDADIINLRWRPHLIEALILGGHLDRVAEERLFGDNYPLRLRTLLCDYDRFAPVLEAPLYSDPESVARLVCFLAREEKQPYADHGYYLQLLEADPNLYLRSIQDADQRAFVRDELVARAEVMKNTSAAWALFYIRANAEVLRLTPDMIQTLAPSEEYRYLAASMLSQRHAPTAAFAEAISGFKSPRWIYHLLRDGLALDVEAAQQALYPHPEWLVQYMMRAKVPAVLRDRLYSEAAKYLIRKDPANPIELDLHAWYMSLPSDSDIGPSAQSDDAGHQTGAVA